MDAQKKILIIDDEEDLCMLIKGYFLKNKYDVHIANTLQDGMNKVKTLSPDIIFLDNNLPDGTGWNMAAQIANDAPNAYINLISAYHPTIPKMPAFANFRIIEKPIKIVDLELCYLKSN
ncbi:MAG: response regulator [Bacteroidota bacterium]